MNLLLTPQHRHYHPGCPAPPPCYSLADATKLSGLLLQPFINAFKYEQ